MKIKRFVGKVSDDNPEEGLINLIAKMTGLAPSEIKLSDEMLSQVKLMQNEKLAIKEIISPFYDDLKSEDTKESNKKLYELIDLGKFIYYLNDGKKFKIIECGESPDFIVQFDSELIGIEHTGIYDDNIVAEIKTVKRLIKKCEIRLIQVNPELKGLFNIIIRPSAIKGKLSGKQAEISDTISDCVIAEFNKKIYSKPNYIVDIVKTNHPILELSLGEDYWLEELTPSSIASTILKKESKIVSYKTPKGLNKCWLLIVIDGASSASSFDIKLHNLPIHLTQFDKVFLFDTFKAQIIQGKKK